MYVFLLLSFFSGMLELGSVYIGLKLGLSMGMTLLLPFSYQIGNLMINIVKGNRYKTFCMVCIIGILAPAWFIYHHLWVIAIQIALISYCIQDLRSKYKAKCPTWLKRSFRIGGFIVSPIMFIADSELSIILCTSACLLSLLTLNNSNEMIIDASEKKQMSTKKISFVMIFHQLHYFVYTYLMPVYMYQHTKNIFYTSFMFASSWIIYLFPQVIVEKYGLSNYKKIFFVCHTFLAICMAGVTISIWSKSILMTLVFWMLTGLGGGSVFCIKYLSPIYQRMDMALSENIGHLLGPLLAIFICYITHKNSVIVLPALSFLFVIATILIAFKIVKESRYEQ